MLAPLAHNETFRVSVAQVSVLSTRTRTRDQARLMPLGAPEASREAREVSTPKRGAALMNDTDTSHRLMVILVQPDSDSFDTSATAIRYAAEGVAITLVTAAGGQRGRSGSTREPHALREVVSLESVGGDLDQVEPEQIICELVAHIRRVQPHVVITSGPLAGHFDPDRLAISQFACGGAKLRKLIRPLARRRGADRRALAVIALHPRPRAALAPASRDAKSGAVSPGCSTR